MNTQGGVAGGVTSRPVGSIEKDGGERAEQGPGEGGGADDVEESELAAESQVCWEEPGPRAGSGRWPGDHPSGGRGRTGGGPRQ